MDQLRRLLGRQDDASHRRRRLVCDTGSLLHRLDCGFDQRSRVLGGLSRFAGQVADLVRHHCKAFSCGAGSGGFHRRIQGQNIRLEGDIFDGFDDFADFRGRIVDLRHRSRHLLHLLLPLLQLRSRRHRLLAG